jgi:predicted phage terminase large subunit-like protein
MKDNVTIDLHDGQRRVIDERKRFNVICCGRRWGKSRLAFALALETIAHRMPVVYMTPTAVDYEKRWSEAVEFYRPILKDAKISEGVLIFTNGARMDWFGLHRYDGIRGNRYARAIIDEAAHSPNLEDAWTKVVRPALADFLGDAYFLSTPAGGNYFKTLYETKHSAWQSWQMPTTSNPFIDVGEIMAAKEDPNTPDIVFRQEYMAEFIDLQGALVNREDIRYGQPAEGDRIEYNMGVDLAISTKEGADYTAIAVVGKVENRYYIVDVMRRQMGFNDTKTAIKKMAAKWSPTFVNIEAVQYQAAIVEDLKMEMREYYVNAIHPDRDKRSRFLPTLGKYEHGLVYHSPSLPPEFEGELLQFPEGDHEDMVDAMVYAMKGFDSGVRVYNI